MTFAAEITVRFAHVDAAGIVFYPRYFEMLNETVERWFDEGLGLDFRELLLVQRRGAPTKRMTVEFLKPSRLGDRLTFALRVVKVGRATFDLEIDCTCGDELRFKAASTLVYTTLEPVASTPIPDDLRRKMMTFSA